jgi:aquaporin Z
VSRYLTEMIGTFFLVLSFGFAAVSGTSQAPLAIGSMLMVMVYMGGHVSGAHYNPAVTLALHARGKLDTSDVIPYILAQLAGAALASLLVLWVTGRTFAPAPGPGVGALPALLAELVLSFALVLVFLNVTTHPDTTGNPYFGLAIGFTVAAGMFAVGPVSGGAFNPALGIGPIVIEAIAGGGGLGNLWLYLVGPVAAGYTAAAVFRVQLEDL